MVSSQVYCFLTHTVVSYLECLKRDVLMCIFNVFSVDIFSEDFKGRHRPPHGPLASLTLL